MTSPSQVGAPGDLLTAWRARVAQDSSAIGLRYCDGNLTVADMDYLSTAIASALRNHGVEDGDRIGISLQNIPYFPLLMLGIWKVGGSVLLLNPAYRHDELGFLLSDSRARGVVCAPDAVETMLQAGGDCGVGFIWTASGSDFPSHHEGESRGEPAPADGVRDLRELITLYSQDPAYSSGRTPDSPALLAYTSGTTGPPKGAVCSDSNVLSVVSSFAPGVGVAPGDVILAVAPLFHITGAVVTACMALLGGSELVMIGRFQPDLALEALAEHGVTYTIGAITAFNAIARLESVDSASFRTVRSLYSGGAPVPPAVVDTFEKRFGVYIHNAYGMTETTSGVIAVPRGQRAPVDPESGALSIGQALSGVEVRIVDPEGNDCQSGKAGELYIRGPQVISGYWRNPEATRATFEDSWLKTGDVAFRDDEGWIYLVDRLKDQINVSGFKVWPREVEDVLYRHPCVHEAAVVGRSDDYQGESVAAFVCLHPGESISQEDLREFVRARLAPYKVPRTIEFVSELPKTQTGKIKRRDLR